MSNMSNFSSYSMASQAKVLEQKQEIYALKRELAKALNRDPTAHQCTSAQALTQPVNNNLVENTPTRKRPASQPLGGRPKGSRVVGGKNRFDVLTQAESYPDKSMRPGSICSNSNKASYAKVTGKSAATRSAQPATTTPVASHPAVVPGLDECEPLEVEGIFCIKNDRALREEIEVQFLSLNNEKFSGTITYQEAKHVIFKDCLGFGDFSNFDGARVGFKNVPVVTFKLKTAINVDELFHLRKFIFHRKSTRQGVSHTDQIHCMISGLRQHNPEHASNAKQSTLSNSAMDDGTRKIQIQGCEYRIPKEVLVEYLSNFGELVSDIREALFDDGGDPLEAADGTNRTGNYNVKIKLRGDIPQLLPILGKRIRIFYPGIPRLCTNCFKGHHRSSCHSKKMSWTDYTKRFISDHPDINLNLVQRQKPQSRAFNATTESVVQMDVTTSGTPVHVDLDESTSTSYTSDWVEKHVSINQAPTEQTSEDSRTASQNGVSSQASVTDSQTSMIADPSGIVPPSKKDFMVPANRIEHDQMVAKLISAGIIKSEAEQIISMRKNAFNKACRDAKKLGENANKKVTKNSKLVSSKSKQNGN